MQTHTKLLLLLAGVGACAGEEAAFDSGSSTGGAAGAGGTTQSGAGFTPAGGASAQGGSAGFEPCASVSATAEAKILPADIIWAVDTSASMKEEAAQVQANMNAFASIILASGIDVRVILISDKGQGQNTGPPQPYEICIPPPLGNGADASGFCDGKDEKLPTYRHVVEAVSSKNAIDIIVKTYPEYKTQLRPGAVKVVAVVSDDDSALSASEATAKLAGLDPSFQGLVFDAIAAEQGPTECVMACQSACGTCGPCCPGCQPISAAEGAVYKALVQQTGGVFGDLCQQSFAGVFQAMAKGVVAGAKVPCEYALPAPPPGETLDPDQVNVQYLPGGAPPPKDILRVKSAADCGQKGGWYYDDNTSPQRIHLCPTTCRTVGGDPDAKIDVLFGCASVYQPPS
jgi:hypothetical protein